MVQIAKATVNEINEMKSTWNQLPKVKWRMASMISTQTLSADEENLLRAQGARCGIAREQEITGRFTRILIRLSLHSFKN